MGFRANRQSAYAVSTTPCLPRLISMHSLIYAHTGINLANASDSLESFDAAYIEIEDHQSLNISAFTHVASGRPRLDIKFRNGTHRLFN